MFLIAARFALSFGGDTWIQPEFLEGSSCKLELHFKSKIINESMSCNCNYMAFFQRNLQTLDF